MNRFIQVLLLSTATLVSSNAFAFDSERNGFLIGLGLGVTHSSIEIDYKENSDRTDRDTSETSLVYSFKLGGGIGRKAALYLLVNRSDNSDISYGYLGIGGTFYFNEYSPSFYLNGGIGQGSVINDERFMSDGIGEAYLIGVGFEPIRGLHLELNLMNINADDDAILSFRDNADYDVFNTQFMVGFTWF